MVGPWSPLTDLLDAEVAPVVSVTWAGRTWRLGLRSVVGSDYEIEPGLLEAPDISDEVSLSPGGDSAVSVAVAVVLPAIAVADYIAAGYDLIDVTVEVALVWHRRGEGLHAWAAREVRAQGDLSEPQWGDPTLPAGAITGTVEDSPYRSEGPLCRETWEITLTTWPLSPEQDTRYPLVLGRADPPENHAFTTGIPAPVIDQTAFPLNSKVLLSPGWCAASTVRLVDPNGLREVFTITYEADGLGQLCAVADISGAATVSLADTTQYYQWWVNGPALAPMGGANPLEIAAYLLALGGADLDLPEWVSIAQLYRGLEVGGYVDDPDSLAWEVARDILTGIAVSTRRSRDGWAPVVLDPHIGRQMASTTWRDGGPWRRTSAWTVTETSRVTRADVTSEVSTITAGASDARDAGLPHGWTRDIPRQSEASLSLAWSWSATTDYRVLGYTARIQALGWEAASYQVPAQWGRERAGEWVYLADDDRYCLVQRRTLADGIWDYTLARPVGR